MTEFSNPKAKRYLAWDTSSATGVVTAFEIDGTKLGVVASFSLSLETSRHSERLLWSIDTVLQSAGWVLSEITGIAVGVGPGSFTGLRIGVTTAKLLASTLKIKLIPVSSLALLARYALDRIPNDQNELENTVLIVCTDATKGEWFTLLTPASLVKDYAKLKESAMTPVEVGEKFGTELKKLGPDARWLAVGQSVERYPEIWNELPQKGRILDLGDSVHRIHPETLTELAFEAIQAGIESSPADLKPRYLRDSEAEVKLRKGELNLNPLLLK